MKRPQKPPVLPPDQNAIGDHTIPISQEKWIGRVVVEFSKLDAAMDDLIWQFFNLPIEFGRIITARMDTTSKITMLRALSDTAFDADPMLQHYLKDALDNADILREFRNLIVHGTWGRTRADQTPIAMSLRIKDTPSTVVSETFSPERMQAIWTAIQLVKWRLIPLFESARASHHRSRERFPPPPPIPQPSRGDQTD
jgi:hypothetical protein